MGWHILLATLNTIIVATGCVALALVVGRALDRKQISVRTILGLTALWAAIVAAQTAIWR
jgi:hypothetical protein